MTTALSLSANIEGSRAALNKDTKLVKCWIWNRKVSDLIKEKATGYSLNCPAGMSEIGSILGDLDPKRPVVQKMDYNALPFPNNTFDTVIQDPPWKIGYYQRMRPFFECVRVCKPGGTIIYNATWIPQSKEAKLVETYARQDGQFANASIISIFRKMPLGRFLE